MVQPDSERQLDDVILDVFEHVGSSSSGRQFFFPVTSQHEARAFVRELNRRGVQYSRICATVGELEDNLTAWRTGLSHPGIGNRVVERINRPLQQLLLAVDDLPDDDTDVRLVDVEDDDDVLTEFSSSLPPTPVKLLRRTAPAASPGTTGLSNNVTEQSRDDEKFVNTSQTATTLAATIATTLAATPENSSGNDVHKSTNTDVDIAPDVEQSMSRVICTEDEKNNNDVSSRVERVEVTGGRGVTNGEVKSDGAVTDGEVAGDKGVTNGEVTGDRCVTDGQVAGDRGVTNGEVKSDGAVTDGEVAGDKGVTNGDRDVTDGEVAGDGCVTDGEVAGDRGVTYGEVGSDRGITDGEVGGDRGVTNGEVNSDGGVTNGEVAGDRGVTDGEVAGDRGVTYGEVNSDGGVTNGEVGGDRGVTNGEVKSDGAVTDGEVAGDKGVTNGDRDVTNGEVAGDRGVTDGKVAGDRGVTYGEVNSDGGVTNGEVAGDKGVTNGEVNSDGGVTNGQVTGDRGVTNGEVNSERGVTDGEYINGPVIELIAGHVNSQEEDKRTDDVDKVGARGGDDGDNEDDDDEAVRGVSEAQDSWVTQLSVNLTPDTETSDHQHRQISVTSAAATTDQIITFATTTTDQITTFTTTTDHSANTRSTLLLSGTTGTDVPEVNGNVTSQPEAQTNSTITSDWPSNDHTAASSHFTVTDPHPPETNVHVMLQPEIELPTDSVDNSEKPEVVAILDQQEITPQTTASDDLTITGNSGNMTSSTAQVEATARSEVTPETTLSSDVTSESGSKCVLRKTSRKREDYSLDDVDENYDSDDDDDVDDDSEEFGGGGSSHLEVRGRGRRKAGKRWGWRYQDDGPGYVYVFTDTAADCSAHCRVKISASRRPHARLRQARLFNVDVRLVSAVSVTRRHAAACLLKQRLADSAIPATIDWFNTSLDVVVNSVMDVARIYSPPGDCLDD